MFFMVNVTPVVPCCFSFANDTSTSVSAYALFTSNDENI
jgi:hypothetical protein